MSRRLLACIFALAGLAAISVAGATALSGEDMISACYNNANGALRIIDPMQACRPGETSTSWNKAGPPGPPGPPGPGGGGVGPTSVSAGGAEIQNFGTFIASHEITPEEAGLNLISATAMLKDMDGSQGGVKQVLCSLMLGSGGVGDIVTLHDTGVSDRGDTASWTLYRRDELAAGVAIAIRCEPLDAISPGPSGIFGIAHLMLQRVDS